MRTLRLGLALLALVGCGPREGGACQGERAHCLDGTSALWCLDGHFERVLCLGESGCATDGRRVTCHTGVARVGQLCIEPGLRACTPDGASVLTCDEQHRFQLLALCRGPLACSTEGDAITCDGSVGVAGDACVADGAACTADGLSFLSCREGVLVHVSDCRGPAGCSREDGVARCDESIARVGDPCLDQSGHACSLDGSELLTCDGTAWRSERPCSGAEHCARAETGLRCDQSISTVGDACGMPRACSSDGRTTLDCVDGHFVRGGRCPGRRGCTVSREPAGLVMRCDGGR